MEAFGLSYCSHSSKPGRETATASTPANNSWPNDAALYQPFEPEQMLLAEKASCLAVKTYLQMCQLPYAVASKENAEHMSPGGRLTKLPVLCVAGKILSEFESIVDYVDNTELGLTNGIDELQKHDISSIVSLVESTFTMAELYVSFIDIRVYREITAPLSGLNYPWPFKLLKNHLKRAAAIEKLRVYQWHELSLNEVCERLDKCCHGLSSKLNESPNTPYFFGENPCELDAIVFGHLQTILSTKLPNTALLCVVRKYANLVEFCHFIDRTISRTG